ncbi:transcription regulator NOT2/NOT3/NOT5 family protein [Klebsormidium nitens]|uniref:Transcription regulator NOT2/NOT3/NOT5 family protein n=1 Tax=Klebsormidium nitens TaxID=105231 RepID=A0A1Y1IIP1_KLENI|nr:transcription regulator NOT2/NOT3/NOT5 family protein [Klebsormidium nitens]|eukprot:GAQ88596.1 transcription regulator NOT2/NOT3/NOT5 family protein [Klebsormidium nitens]
MGAARKMQAEMEKTLKKVQEGTDLFEEIWKKMEDATESTKKEKSEAELKHQLKRLQRSREQIRLWLASSDIKAIDKKSLEGARRQIESDMERFKICERAAKIKAFSKEGLELQPKIDPEEAAKEEAKDFINKSLDDLQLQVDEFESEMETISGASAKAQKKDIGRLQELEKVDGQHKWHKAKLEQKARRVLTRPRPNPAQVHRLLENQEITPEDVLGLRDSLEYYLEQNQSPDFFFDDTMYEELPMDKLDAKVGEELTSLSKVLPLPKEATKKPATEPQASPPSPASNKAPLKPLPSPKAPPAVRTSASPPGTGPLSAPTSPRPQLASPAVLAKAAADQAVDPAAAAAAAAAAASESPLARAIASAQAALKAPLNPELSASVVEERLATAEAEAASAAARMSASLLLEPPEPQSPKTPRRQVGFSPAAPPVRAAPEPFGSKFLIEPPEARSPRAGAGFRQGFGAAAAGPAGLSPRKWGGMPTEVTDVRKLNMGGGARSPKGTPTGSPRQPAVTQIWQVKEPTERKSPQAERAEPPEALLDQHQTQNEEALRNAIESHLKKAEEARGPETRPSSGESSTQVHPTPAPTPSPILTPESTPGIRFGASPGPNNRLVSQFGSGRPPSELQMEENMFRETAGGVGSLAETPEAVGMAALAGGSTPEQLGRPFNLERLFSGMGVPEGLPMSPAPKNELFAAAAATGGAGAGGAFLPAPGSRLLPPRPPRAGLAPFAQQSPPVPPVALTELEHHLLLRERMRVHQEQLAQLEHMRMQQFHAAGGYFYPQGQPLGMMQPPEWREQGPHFQNPQERRPTPAATGFPFPGRTRPEPADVQPGSGGPRPASAGPRPASEGGRPGSGGARPGSGGTRPGSGGNRHGSGSFSPPTGQLRPRSGGRVSGSASGRPGSGGSAPSSAGGRPGSGGERPGSGSKRPGSAPGGPLSPEKKRSAGTGPEESRKAAEDRERLEALENGMGQYFGDETPRLLRPPEFPASYPTTSIAKDHEAALFRKLDLETHFFAFYFQKNTVSQYLAARELKRNSWRYHKKHCTWFQRHCEPEFVTDDGETGAYRYFDFNLHAQDPGVASGPPEGWCQRIKERFLFEYKHLEDELPVPEPIDLFAGRF